MHGVLYYTEKKLQLPSYEKRPISSFNLNLFADPKETCTSEATVMVLMLNL